jgi:hypothetical protein
MEEALAPEADDIAPDGEGGGDVVIGMALGGQEDHVGPHHLKVRQRIGAHPAFQDLSLVSREGDDIGTVSRHAVRPPGTTG